MTFTGAQKIMNAARNRANRKPLGRNTHLVDLGDCFAVRYHCTYVILIYPDGSYVLDSGGWRMVTTKRRINQYTPADVQLWQEKGVWYIAVNHRTYIFQDGMRIGPRRGVTGAKRYVK